MRLRQGDFDQETVYNDDPLEAARAWADAGARFLHVIDLDGAREGKPQNLDHLERITSELTVPVQYGGGLRDVGAVRAALAAGADRVILGTAAYTDVEFLDACVASWPSRVLVAIDVRGGRVSVAGWTKATQMRPEDVIERMQAPRGAAVRLHERRPRRDARGPRPGRGQAHRRDHPRPLPLLGRDRLARGLSRACARCGS